MRLICLNTWGGKLYELFTGFIDKYKETTDIFCLQEIFTLAKTPGHQTGEGGRVPDLYERLVVQLRGFKGHLAESHSTSFGERLTTFVRDPIKIDAHGDIELCHQKQIMVDGQKFSVGSGLQWVSFKLKGKHLTVCNIHGIWLPGGKGDSPERLVQSENVAKFLAQKKGAKILCGDLNLSPQTQSITILERLGLRNLVKEYGITSTRSSYYEKDDKFADYIFCSPDVTVRNFRALKEEEISDHLPLLIEFD